MIVMQCITAGENILLLKEILSDGTEDSIEMHAKPNLNCLCV